MGDSDRTRPEMLPRDAVLSERQAEQIEACLDWLMYESEARCIILADRSGRLISERGRTSDMNTHVLSALAAGELAATREMARMVGEKARFKLLLHEGERRSIYLSDVEGRLILVIVFDVATPIGLVRMLLREALGKLEQALEQDVVEEVSRHHALTDGLVQQLKDRMDELF